MNTLIVTNTSFPARLYRSGILKFFLSSELRFLVTDFCYEQRKIAANSDHFCAIKLIEEKKLEVKNLDEKAINELANLSKKLSSKFLIKTISSLLLAMHERCPIVSDDETLRDEAKKLGLIVMSHENLVDDLILKLYSQGTEIDIEIVKMIT